MIRQLIEIFSPTFFFESWRKRLAVGTKLKTGKKKAFFNLPLKNFENITGCRCKKFKKILHKSKQNFWKDNIIYCRKYLFYCHQTV